MFAPRSGQPRRSRKRPSCVAVLGDDAGDGIVRESQAHASGSKRQVHMPGVNGHAHMSDIAAATLSQAHMPGADEHSKRHGATVALSWLRSGASRTAPNSPAPRLARRGPAGAPVRKRHDMKVV